MDLEGGGKTVGETPSQPGDLQGNRFSLLAPPPPRPLSPPAAPLVCPDLPTSDSDESNWKHVFQRQLNPPRQMGQHHVIKGREREGSGGGGAGLTQLGTESLLRKSQYMGLHLDYHLILIRLTGSASSSSGSSTPDGPQQAQSHHVSSMKEQIHLKPSVG